jgi:hypothetical protein
MPTNETTRKLYFDVMKPLLPDKGRLRLLSYLDCPICDEFAQEIRTWIHLCNGVIAIVDKTAVNAVCEIGVALGHGKPVILVAPSHEDLPDMLRARNVITYNPEDPTGDQVRDKLEKILKATLHGTFIDQRFQDHTSILINSAARDDEMPAAGQSPSPDADDLEGGIHFYRAKQYDKAAAHLESALEAGNRDTDTYFYLADSFFLLGEWLPPGERQRKAYQKMQHYSHEGIRFHLNDKRLRKTFGLSCMKLGDFDRAENIFKGLLSEDPEYTVAAYNLACLHALQQNRSHCLRYLLEVFGKNAAWRYLARLDSDFDGVWDDELIQRVMFPCPISR